MNAWPVLSGLAKQQPIDLIIRHEMIKFRDFKEFLFYQGIFESVEFDNQVSTAGAVILSSWTHMNRQNALRPVETCRYENWLKDNYRLDFQVDDTCTLQVPELDIDSYPDKFIVGDRWGKQQDPDVDSRRWSHVIRDGSKIDQSKLVYLDYTASIFENCALIKQNPNAFITTFTGIGIVADLMHKKTYVCWDEDMRVWDGRPVDFDWERHYYQDRQSKLIYVKDLTL